MCSQYVSVVGEICLIVVFLFFISVPLTQYSSDRRVAESHQLRVVFVAELDLISPVATN